MTVARISHAEAREQFPALATGFAFLENAGGSQLPQCVIDAMADFMRESYVQTTAGYPASDRATQAVDDAHAFCEVMVGAGGHGRVVLGASTSQLVSMLATCIGATLSPGDEIIVSVANHEANAGPWARLGRSGATVKWWGVDAESGEMDLGALQALLSPRTKIVAFPHTSNLLGNVVDVAAATSLVHEAGGRVVVDGVAYAPHALMDVAAWDVDFYGYSTYKVYGPHMAALYGKSEAWAELDGPNHYFFSKDDVPHKFELGCLNYEGCAGIAALGGYLAALGGRDVFDRETLKLATDRMREWEAPLTRRLLEYLNSKPGVRLVGPTDAQRVPTFSFVSDRVSAPTVAGHVNRGTVGIRYGHMYSLRLAEALGVEGSTGFVRVSAVHYNTHSEVDRLCDSLDEIL